MYRRMVSTCSIFCRWMTATLSHLPLSERKDILHEILGRNGTRNSDNSRKIDRGNFEIRDDEIRAGAEGIICKNPTSRYGDTNSWLKLKRFDTIDCFVIDFEDTPDFKRTGVPRSWFIGLYDDAGQVVEHRKGWVFCGKGGSQESREGVSG